MEEQTQSENMPVQKETKLEKEEKHASTPGKGEKRPLADSNTDIVEEESTVKRARLTRDVLKTVVAQTCTAPVPWRADIGADGSALYIGHSEVVMGTVDGKVLFLDLDGNPKKVIQLPCPVGSIFHDGKFLYAWCHACFSFDKWKGALFDLSGDDPRVLFDFQDFGEWVKWAAIKEGRVVLCDDKGTLVCLDSQGKSIWEKVSSDMCCKVFLHDEEGLYVGYQKRVSRHSWETGEEVWSHSVTGRFAKVINGAQDEKFLYVEAAGKIIQLNKATGEEIREFCPARHRASGVCVGNGILVTGSCPTVVFSLKTGEEIIRLNLPGRMADAKMKMHPSGKLYIAWDEAVCVDLTKHSLQRAMEGKSSRTHEIKLTGQTVILPRDVIDMTSDTSKGVTVKCVERDGKLEVFPVTEGYESTWSVRFPILLRFPDVKYVVDELIPNERYKFYSILGDIRELVEPEQVESGASTPRTPRPIRSKPNTPLAGTPRSKNATPLATDTPLTTRSKGTPTIPATKLGSLQLDTPKTSKIEHEMDAEKSEQDKACGKDEPDKKMEADEITQTDNNKKEEVSKPESKKSKENQEKEKLDKNELQVAAPAEDTLNKSYKEALMEGLAASSNNKE